MRALVVPGESSWYAQAAVREASTNRQRSGEINFPFQEFFQNLRDFTYDATGSHSAM